MAEQQMADTRTEQMLDVSDASAEEAVRRVIEHATQMGASDLYMMANESFMAINVRHLGIVRSISIVGAEQGRLMVQHVKANAGMDISEHRRPLDGRWIYESEDEAMVDLRIGVIPTLYGEDMTMRLLSREMGLIPLDELGFVSDQLDLYQNMIQSPSGLVLCTGPTGSGKTTTLYASLMVLNDGSRKINTIEDPIEYAVEGLRQSQISTQRELSFADMLKATMRQSPDVIMIGEIRDPETARIATLAANTGHLVFSTLHAPIAAGAIQSMKALGVHPHFLATALRGVLSQRLLRTLDPKSRIEFDISHAPDTFEEIEHLLGPDEGKKFFAPKDHRTGYTGRTAVFELMEITHEIRSQISAGEPTAVIRAKALEQGMLEFRQVALLKVARGVTSIEEVFRVIPREHLLLED